MLILAFALLAAAPSRPPGPCDLYAAAGTPCVAAHSTTRALSSTYRGPLYQVKRMADGKTLDIGIEAGGTANAAAQDAFCAKALCVIDRIYDQSGKGNHLYQAPPGPLFPGPAKGAFDTQPIADMAPITIGGRKAYGVYMIPGMGFRNNDARDLAVNDEAEGIYYVIDGTHYDSGCCFDYGNASTNGRAVGTGTMETAYFGTATAWGRGSGPGPWLMADMEDGLFSGYEAKQNAASPTIDAWRFVTAVVNGGGGNRWELRGGNAQTGSLATFYKGIRPGSKTNNAYYPMHKQGAVLLGIGGDNGNGSAGTFYEGVMTSGYPSEAATDAVQANIVAARYKAPDVRMSRLTTFTPGSTQQLTVTGPPARVTAPKGWTVRPVADRPNSFRLTSPVTTGAGVLTVTANRPGAVAVTQNVRNVYPVKINEAGFGAKQFIELFNASSSDVDLSGWKLTHMASQWATVPLATIPARTKLAAGGFYVLFLAVSGLSAPVEAGAASIHVRATDGLAQGQIIDVDGETRIIASLRSAAAPMTTVFIPVASGPWLSIPAGATNLPVTSSAGFEVGQKMAIDLGGDYEIVTVSAVGKAGTQTTLAAPAEAGAKSIRVTAAANLSPGGLLTIATGARKESCRIARIADGSVELATPLKFAHAKGIDVSDPGTGISFSPATRFAHRSGDAVQALGGGMTLDKPLAKSHAYGAPVGAAALPEAQQRFGINLASRAGSIALLDAAGVVVDALVYGSQQSSSSGNGTITSPELAVLEGDQGRGGCIAVLPGPPRNFGPASPPPPVLDRSLGRYPDGADADSLCTDFLIQPATVLPTGSFGGADNIKVAGIEGFVVGHTITIGTGASQETGVVAKVGTPGATTITAATGAGVTVLPVASGVGFAAGQSIMVDTGANTEAAIVLSATRNREGATITLQGPLKMPHAAGTLVAGSGITLAAPLTKAHAGATRVSGGVPTPGAPNQYRRNRD